MASVPGAAEALELEDGLDPPPPRGRVLSAARDNPLLAVGMVMCIAIAAIAILAPFIAPFPGDAGSATHPLETLRAPSAVHLFGTDQVGRDIFSRVLYGARISPVIALVVLVISVTIGVPLGLAAGYFGGLVDEIIMRITDVFLAFPALLLALAFAAVLRPSITTTIVAISVTWWPWYTRIIRGQAASVASRPFVESARASGISHFRTLLRHVLPNSITPIIVQVSLDVGGVILTASALSFLGLGAQDPTPDWGLLVSQGQSFFTTQWWLVTFPGLAILMTAGERRVVDLERLDVGAAEVVGLAGESGSGKSITALAAIGLAGTLGATVSGSIRFEGEELVGADEMRLRDIRGSRVAMIFQSPVSALDPLLPVGALFARALRLHGASKREASDRARSAMGEVLLSPDLLSRYPHELSGGQAQRVAIAMALALRSELVLADEPTSALDVTVQAEILDLLRALREDRGMSVLFISHDLAVIAELCDRVAVMQGGNVVEEGPTARVLRSPVHEYTRRLVAAVPKLRAPIPS
jgi:ABC-type dipeptide/oligopeptide/nickel transport system permease subunit/ABC-type dipeptide/oligopeptide/nickel transport system ATPase component